MGKFIQNGRTIDYVNPDAVNGIHYGDVVDLDTRIAIAAVEIAPSGEGTLHTEGVYELPAVNNAEFTVGQVVYWTGTQLTDVGAGLTPAGWVVAPKIAAGTVARIKIG